MCPEQKGDPSTPCIIVVYPRDSLLTSSQTQVGLAEPPGGYQQSRFQFGRPRPGRPRATTARNYTYLRAMARLWCHLTTRTVLIEWQPILIPVTQGYCEVFTHVCLIEWQNFTVRKPTQQKKWWNVNSYYRTWLLIYKVYCKYISCIENIVKPSWVTFSYNQAWRNRLRHIIVRNVSINTVLTSPSPQL